MINQEQWVETEVPKPLRMVSWFLIVAATTSPPRAWKQVAAQTGPE